MVIRVTNTSNAPAELVNCMTFKHRIDSSSDRRRYLELQKACSNQSETPSAIKHPRSMGCPKPPHQPFLQIPIEGTNKAENMLYMAIKVQFQRNILDNSCQLYFLAK